MIQRIQSLYLLLVALAMGLTLFLPLAHFSADTEQFDLFACALRDSEGARVQSTVYMGVLCALACLLAAINLLLFKWRMLQIRLCVVEMVLLVGAQIMMAIYYFLSYRAFALYEFHAQRMTPAILIPLACLVLDYLAVRAIFKDEMLVRSADRIR